MISVFNWPWPEDSIVWVYLIPKFTYPLNNMCFCSSVFLTVLIACERYLAVCHPIAYRQMSISSSNKQRLSDTIFWSINTIIIGIGILFQQLTICYAICNTLHKKATIKRYIVKGDGDLVLTLGLITPQFIGPNVASSGWTDLCYIFFICRLLLYLVPVVLISILLNIPKYFETEIVTQRVLVNLTVSNNSLGHWWDINSWIH